MNVRWRSRGGSGSRWETSCGRRAKLCMCTCFFYNFSLCLSYLIQLLRALTVYCTFALFYLSNSYIVTFLCKKKEKHFEEWLEITPQPRPRQPSRYSYPFEYLQLPFQRFAALAWYPLWIWSPHARHEQESQHKTPRRISAVNCRQ